VKTDVVRLVTFRLADGWFAADILCVERVIRYAPPGGVPDVPAWIEGVLDYRGRPIPVVDLRRRIELPAARRGPETRILVLDTSAGWVGAIVDRVLEIAVVPASSVTPPPELFRGFRAEFVRGIARVGEQLAVVLDVDRVLTSTERIAFDEALAEAAEGA